MSRDTPEIATSNYCMTTYGGDGLYEQTWKPKTIWRQEQVNKIQVLLEQDRGKEIDTYEKEEVMGGLKEGGRRVVQVFIADPNEDVPLDDSLLYQGEQKLTDLTDQELFFEISIQDILTKHNEKRIKFLDKESSKKAGRDIFLEAVKIRDLKMVVVNLVAF